MTKATEGGVIGAEAVLQTKADNAADPRAAFRAFVTKGTAQLLVLARHLLRDEEEARDLVQDALIRAYTSLDSFRWECSLKNWVRRIVVNQGLKRLRRRRLHQRVAAWLWPASGRSNAAGWSPAPGANPEESAQLRERMQALSGALSQLSPRQRTVVVLRYLEGMSVPEIAADMDIGPGTVKTHLVRAMRQLRAAGFGEER